MSAYSDWKVGALSDDEYEFCVRRECKDYPPDFEDTYEYQCSECEYCVDGKRFSFDVVERIDGKHVLKQTHNYTMAEFCIRDKYNIKEIHGYDDICEDHGELIREEDT